MGPDHAAGVAGRKGHRELASRFLLAAKSPVDAALLGFTNLWAASADVARVLFYIFGVSFLVLIVLGFTAFRTR
jgi:uncharacterized membrane protein YtjA (UPF0391 family)